MGKIAIGDLIHELQKDSNLNSILSLKNSSFKSLLDFIATHQNNTFKSPKNSLNIYDLAVFIGYFINVFPDEVYLHSGTYVGAEKLIHNMNLHNQTTLSMDDIKQHNTSLYNALQSLQPHAAYAEDFFCLAKTGSINVCAPKKGC
ncbi:hypothetical protein [Pediococcus argentinicus]|uniref:Uncharacterized protein n=1 Tax=Pediococcus argentinicus TaxID=480391 RepID=A0A0R2NNS8_9LACO|nr:hypothetical protein [Pediococcus argentinicus]KRO25661.1 hypothetical protein IV88_GL001619 [Pediococcus argentinicus]NKZ22002.1 hypothetical protein [Pediococcus argentinicus]GEP19171.1 hypothetical protein LSA03_05550 [Pediococcus argentinicus]